jgi:malonate transporter
MVLSSLFPVFALILCGSVLKHFHFTHDLFLKTSDKLVYYLFFPALLFWKIGGASLNLFGNRGFYIAAVCALLTVFVLSTLFMRIVRVSPYQAGSFSQSCYRFNTYIGVAVVLNALGEEGVRQFGILIGMMIPMINVLAVSTLMWFSGKQPSGRARLWQTAKALIGNPLIIACLGGIVYSNLQSGFPQFIANTLALFSSVTLPLALISIGGALNLSTMRNHLKLSFLASLFKLLLLPAAGYAFFTVFGVSGLAFKVGMIFFALPTATSLYVLSSQLNSDTALASASIALSTILSFFSLSLVLLI